MRGATERWGYRDCLSASMQKLRDKTVMFRKMEIIVIVVLASERNEVENIQNEQYENESNPEEI